MTDPKSAAAPRYPADVEPHIRTEGEIQDLSPRMEVLADKLCQTSGLILWALKEAGLTVVLLDPHAREVVPDGAKSPAAPRDERPEELRLSLEASEKQSPVSAASPDARIDPSLTVEWGANVKLEEDGLPVDVPAAAASLEVEALEKALAKAIDDLFMEVDEADTFAIDSFQSEMHSRVRAVLRKADRHE